MSDTSLDAGLDTETATGIPVGMRTETRADRRASRALVERRRAEASALLSTDAARAALALHGTPLLLLDPERVRRQHRRLRNALPFVRKLDLSLSTRYDNYSEIGSTSNPRVALGWEVDDGLRLRANYSRSFVAPQLSSVGDRSRGGLTSFSGYGASNQTLIVPQSSFPLAAQVPGVTCANGQCTISSTVNGNEYERAIRHDSSCADCVRSAGVCRARYAAC